MTDSATVPTPFPTEKTFRAFTQAQGASYAQGRPGYHQALYNQICDHHASTGGKLDTLLDVGCGPGTVARELGPRFARAIGLDPAEGMIAAARSLGGASSTSEPIRFDVSTAEELGSNLSPAIPDASVDLITAATAAHWFDMPGFWAAAARVLKPGGSVAIWTGSAKYVHPATPNLRRLQETLLAFRQEHLVPYMVHGNHVGEALYATLPLPWTLEKPVTEFDESTFFRRDWNKDGVLTPGDEYFLAQQVFGLNDIEKFLETVSPVARWREAHPDAIGTERDVVKMLRKEIETLLSEAGVEKGKEAIITCVAGALLMVKKKA
ncbi:methyltransferase domain-containing protein [Colletotrichum tofieldiae]|uniref:Methyltransferase domain-containing protein n=1 Tax=Colletotrichum tofieldiae TaxID=708197 RepID=A0A166VZY1_9PEZI|nr:methyltransferase domain-containing protein [Colletotrichum tofieldiae]GKT64684.1 methyltransferase domain-containing protein [Colletotrichum tofieldiae]GKT74656.1 methyltransferase domain-containing protein [Colletotrichum tofieldiae]GKT91845.1 methyltransferase domain-containing protein [Colletotrichum tofieldiae]